MDKKDNTMRKFLVRVEASYGTMDRVIEAESPQTARRQVLLNEHVYTATIIREIKD